MMNKINITDVIKDHLETIRDYDTRRIGPADIITFLGIPLIIACGVSIFACALGETVIGILITAFSIFTALLLNLLILIFSITKGQTKGQDERSALRHKFLKEIFANISFGILSSAFLTVLLILLLFAGEWLYRIILFLSSFMLANFFLTLLMILKRIHILLKNEF